MVERGWGRVVNIASTAGREGNPNLGAYSATKAAVIGWASRTELATTGVLVNAVAPAVIETPMNGTATPAGLAHLVSLIPMRRIGLASEVAELARLGPVRLLDRRRPRHQRWPGGVLGACSRRQVQQAGCPVVGEEQQLRQDD
jgi:NAD(P)-dependent dehydrogenase (short-subunit alcohol dehydrogenase family)